MRRASVRVALSVGVLLWAVICVGSGLLYVSGRRSFRQFTDRELDTRAAEVEAYLRTAGPAPVALARDASKPEQFTQVVDDGGSVVLTSSTATSHDALISTADEAGPEDAVAYRTRSVNGVAARARLRVSRVRSSGRVFMLVVGSDLDEHDRAQRHRLMMSAISAALAAALVALLAERLTRRAFAGARRLAHQLDRLPDHPGAVDESLPVPELRELTDHATALAHRVITASARERTFIAAASHDLMGRAVHMMNQLDLAAMSNPSGLPASALAEPKEAAHDLVGYLGAMLDLSRLHAVPPDDRVPVDLRHLADRLLADADVADRPILEVTGSATAHAEPVDVERALRNLVANAVCHARSRVTITISTARDLARVEVLDDGPGFPDAVLQQFDQPLPHYGEHRVGNGLGLHIARTALERNGGTLMVGSHPAGGGLAVASLPALPEHCDDATR